MTPSPRVVAVVVAFNRRDLVTETLESLFAQSRPVDAVIVVDNGSTDGTSELVAERFPRARLLTLDRNTGGAGGFAVGMERALAVEDADWVWVMDDDTVPTETALEALLRTARVAPEGSDLFASRVVWTDGREHPMNMPRRKPFASRRSIAAAARHNAYPVRSVSFVSMMVSAAAIRRVGLPVAAYFLWNDDFEFTARVLRRSRGYLAADSLVVHKTKVFGSTDADPGERFWLEVRNKLWLFRFSDAFSLPEKALYLVATLRRWARTFLASSDRGVLRRGLATGLRDGLRTAPEPNDVVLDGLPEAIVRGQHELQAGADSGRSR
ncbi:glycosyltransferase family 2 protein [Mycetocola reblochoni]|uniref:Glycosyl transferase, family 2 n=2 Tax=Mycetocola reblochoni TaxID=331618 RepID=A0A1R4K0R6_9MICO|nr:glycosyltransferase family 2 protein [Mycetocola reblochoni]RLP70477.1 glycosyltransferase [Mycetocola reblochoni]SJN37808.1 Glycosyl transferase, family 2 [Mycetocola reblochoni REB411]